MARFPLYRYVLAVALAGLVRPATAVGLLAATFQDHAVLQRESLIPVWGITTAGATVTVTLAKDAPTTSPTAYRLEAHAGPDGRWQVTLPALPAGGPYTLTAANSAGVRETASDILIGDVFLCSGQSNMEYPTRLASDYDQDVNHANNSLIRLFHVPRFTSVAPRTTFGAAPRWEVTSPQSVGEFSAVCYFFGRYLQAAVGVPIGLIESAWGGAVIQAWISAPRIRRLGGYERYLDLLRVYARSPAQAARDWDRIAADRRRLHDPASAASPPWRNQFGLTVLHNGMIAPLGATRIRGILWYQGEANADLPQEYARLLPALIADWRQQFGRSTPVLIAQLPGWGPYRTQPQPSNWARLREVERRVAAGTQHTGLAVTIDVGSTRFLHPTDKQDVGERLALLARNLIYGQSVGGASPSPVSAWRSGGKVRVRFDAHGGGLEIEESNRPVGFQLCDRAERCAFVDAEQHGTDIVLDASSTPGAVTVRYCWADSPICNLYDREGLPAVPFELPIGRIAPDTGPAR